jgi:hypothetical protein
MANLRDVRDSSVFLIDIEKHGKFNPRPRANDTGHGGVGPENLQNYRCLRRLRILAEGISRARSTSRPTLTFASSFFSSDLIDPSGYGEGENFTGFQNVVTVASGNISLL